MALRKPVGPQVDLVQHKGGYRCTIRDAHWNGVAFGTTPAQAEARARVIVRARGRACLEVGGSAPMAVTEIEMRGPEGQWYDSREPDLSWSYVDRAGHHHIWAHSREREPDALPTLRRRRVHFPYPDEEKPYDEDGTPAWNGHAWNCRLCGQLIEPQYRTVPRFMATEEGYVLVEVETEELPPGFPHYATQATPYQAGTLCAHDGHVFEVERLMITDPVESSSRAGQPHVYRLTYRLLSPLKESV